MMLDDEVLIDDDSPESWTSVQELNTTQNRVEARNQRNCGRKHTIGPEYRTRIPKFFADMRCHVRTNSIVVTTVLI